MNPLHALVRLGGGCASRVRNIWFRLLGVDIRGYVWLRRVSIPRQWGDVRLEAGVALDDGVALVCSGAAKPGKLILGERTYVNRHTILMAADHVVVGPDCLIGPNCYITDTEHGTTEGQLVGSQPLRTEPVTPVELAPMKRTDRRHWNHDTASPAVANHAPPVASMAWSNSP